MTTIVEELLDEIIAKDSTNGLGCDNMSVILIKLKRNIFLQGTEPDKDSIVANGVMDKYKSAGVIVDYVTDELMKMIKPHANIAELCAHGDELIESEVKKVFLKDKLKGIAFPTNVSVNELIENYSPLKTAEAHHIKKGDLVKVSLGVHIDGFVVEGGYTLVCSEGESIEGKKADVTHAAYYALQTALRTLTPEHSNLETSDIMSRTAAVYHCSIVPTARSYLQKRNTLEAEYFVPSLNDIRHGESPHYRYENHDVYTLNVLVSSSKPISPPI